MRYRLPAEPLELRDGRYFDAEGRAVGITVIRETVDGQERRRPQRVLQEDLDKESAERNARMSRKIKVEIQTNDPLGEVFVGVYAMKDPLKIAITAEVAGRPPETTTRILLRNQEVPAFLNALRELCALNEIEWPE